MLHDTFEVLSAVYGADKSAYVGDLEVLGTGETLEDDVLITLEMAVTVEEAVRRWRGWDQGCMLSVFASVYPYHLPAAESTPDGTTESFGAVWP